MTYLQLFILACHIITVVFVLLAAFNLWQAIRILDGKEDVYRYVSRQMDELKKSEAKWRGQA